CTSSARGPGCAPFAPATPRTMSTAAARPTGALMATSLANRRHIITDQIPGDIPTHLFADFQRVAEVDTAPDAYHSLLFGHLADARELTLQAGVGRIRCGECRN